MSGPGIIFSPAMVKALRPDLPAYDDNRKTQTRRLATSPLAKCLPGDKLWVRENCRAVELKDGRDVIEYPADSTWQAIRNTPAGAEDWLKLNHYGRRKNGPVVRNKVVPSIHMPRWASRMVLFVREVRIEPLQAISEADAIAEGAQQVGVPNGERDGNGEPIEVGCYIAGYADLWDSLHGANDGERWVDNPQVLVLSFSVIPLTISEYEP